MQAMEANELAQENLQLRKTLRVVEVHTRHNVHAIPTDAALFSHVALTEPGSSQVFVSLLPCLG
jgi:hypothetical protein